MSFLNYTIFFLFSALPIFHTDINGFGGVDYSWGAAALEQAYTFVCAAWYYTRLLLCAIAAIVAIVAVLQVYIKMTTGEEGVKKSILYLFGAAIFFVAMLIVFPAFFGFDA